MIGSAAEPTKVRTISHRGLGDRTSPLVLDRGWVKVRTIRFEQPIRFPHAITPIEHPRSLLTKER